jgi:hypothetical protein
MKETPSMALQIFLDGHGKWDLGYLKSQGQPAYTQMPKGCTVHFYIHASKTMMPRDVRNILKGVHTQEPESTIRPFMNAPNMKLSHLGSGDFRGDTNDFETGKRSGRVPRDAVLVNPPRRITLQDAVASIRRSFPNVPELEFHWICCRASSLTATELGGAAGMNARELLYRNQYVFYDRTGPRKVELGRREIK